MSRTATLRDIAEALGLSANTVSKALNGKGGVGEDTVRRIREKAAQLNYTANGVAQSLRLKSTNTIGVIVSDSSHYIFARIIKGVEEEATRHGYNMILCNTDHDYEKERRAIELLVSKRIDGMILAATMLTEEQDVDYIRGFATPFVFLMRQRPDVDAVINDNIKGACRMTGHLLDMGCRRIHFLNLPEDRMSGRERLAGYRRALADRHIDYDPSLVRSVAPDEEQGYGTMKSILDSGESVEAVFCGCDVIAIGAMDAILERGLTIPDDIRLAGYDDIDFASHLRVPLTTVRQPKEAIGRQGAELLLHRIRHPQESPRQIVLEPELVVRQSG